MISILISSTGLAQGLVQSVGDGPHLFLVSAEWQSDQMDMEYPTEERPRSKGSLKDWTPGDHMDASKRYEEEARLLLAEVRGMELVESRLLPYLEIEAMKRAGISSLIARHDREAKEKMELASIHHRVGLQLMGEMEKEVVVPTPSNTTEESVKQANPYMKFGWMEEEAILGW